MFRPAGSGIVRVEGLEGGALAYRMELGQGTHLLRYEAVEDGRTVAGSTDLYDYGVAPSEMPVPAPGGRWQADVTVQSEEGTRAESQSQVFDAASPVEIGGCRYDRVPVVIAYDTEDAYLEGIDYLPALGFGYLAWSETADGGRLATEPSRLSAEVK